MTSQSRRRFLKTAAAGVGAASLPLPFLSRPFLSRAHAAPSLVPRKLPFLPNDELGNYEPTITADGNTIYFARFANNGDKSVKGPSDLFVTRRVRQTGEWPGVGSDWTTPERLPDTVNSEHNDLEPWISPDGNTLYFMSYRNTAGVAGDIYVTRRQPDGSWAPAENLGPNINTRFPDHCFLPFPVPGVREGTRVFLSVRPRQEGAPPTADIYTSYPVNGVWQPAERYVDRLLDSVALKCRFNVGTWDGLILGIISVHDFGNFHTQLYVHYDPAKKEWKGPIVEAPFNNWAVDGACPNFSPDGSKIIWSSRYDRGPGLVSGATGGGLFDLYWLPTSEIVAYYKARAGLV